MRKESVPLLFSVAGLWWVGSQAVFGEKATGSQKEVGIVSNIKILSGNVDDVSDVEAWKASFLKPDMTDREKAVAVWNSVVQFRHQDVPPKEFLHEDLCVHDPIKTFNVYGYGQCCCSASNVEALARAAGLNARGRELRGHTVPEVEWKQDWHMLDASLISYFIDARGDVASVNEIAKEVRTWLATNPGMRGKLASFMANDGWKKGPPLLATCQFYDRNGRLPARSHGWHSTIGEYSGYPPVREQGYSMGYRVNLQLRHGESLTRNWSNKGLHVNSGPDGKGPAPLCIKGSFLDYTHKFGDLARGRIGNGSRVWDVPLTGHSLKRAALRCENLLADTRRQGALGVDDGDMAGILELRMPTSYVYLGGKLTVSGSIGEGGMVRVSFSRNHGLDWKEVFSESAGGPFSMTVDLGPLIHRLYDYRLRFELKGTGTRLHSLRTEHDVQHSQRVLPSLTQGDNTIRFSASPSQGTLTIEGNARSNYPNVLNLREFHPRIDRIASSQAGLQMTTGNGSITFPVDAPGDIKCLRFGCHYRARSPKDGWNLEVSLDDGKSWLAVGRAAGPVVGSCKFVSFDEIPAGIGKALVRFTGRQNNTAMIFSLRVDADYIEPNGGFHPVKTTYSWEENGREMHHVHIADSPHETYVIHCQAKPIMRSLTVELSD
ncbi:MAG: hypothetical protein HOB63_01735 [Opitutae bacterium]|nr:hypothetical protein [Opitutae bacterium]